MKLQINPETKTNITKRLNDKPYYPKSYYLPAEQDRFEASIAKEEQPLWIYKVRIELKNNKMCSRNTYLAQK